MGLFSNIISAIGSGWDDVFGGGGSNNDQQKKKQQNTPITNNNINPGAKISMPTSLNNAGIAQPKPAPTLNIAPASHEGLAPAPVHPQPPPQQSHTLLMPLRVDNPAPAPQNIDIGAPNTGQQENTWGPVANPKGSLIDKIGGAATGALGEGARIVGGTLALGGRFNPIHKTFEGESPNPVSQVVHGFENIDNPNNPGTMIAGNQGATSGQRVGADVTNVASLIPAIRAIPAVIRGIPRAASAIKNLGAVDNAVPAVEKAAQSLKAPEELASEIPLDKSPSSAELPLESPESGIKPVKKPTNAPVGEPIAPAPTPVAPESGVKPVTPPPAPKPITPTEPAPVPAPIAPQPEAITPTVKSAQDAAQQAITKAAEAPPAPEPTPTAETVTPPREVASEAIAQAPEQQVINEAPNVANLLQKTGDSKKDLENVATLLKHNIENGRNYADSSDLSDLLTKVNGHQLGNKLVASNLYKELANAIGPERFAVIEDALQTGRVADLPADERAVAELMQSHLFEPSNTLRAATDKDYVPIKNYSPQLRADTVKSAARTAGNTKTLTGKVNSFNDLLAKSRLSGARTLGTFTDSTGKTLIGDPADLGLVAKKDGTFVDKVGKSYDYSGATNKELRDSGTNLHDLGNSARVAAEDAQNLKVRSTAAQELLNNPEKYGLSETATHNNQPSIILKDAEGNSHELFTDKKTQKALQKSGVVPGYGEDTNLAKSALRAVNSAVVQSIVLNPFVHGTNQLAQAVMASGLRRNGVAGLSLLKGEVSDANLYRFHEAGGYVPTYGKDTGGIIAQMTHGVSKINQKVMSGIDGNFRVRAFDSLTRGGMSDKKAAQAVNKFMGDRNTLDNATKNLTIFWHYFMTLNKSAKAALVETAHGHPGAVVNAGIAAAAWYGLNQAWQDATNNPNASTHAPGIVGLGKQYVTAADDLAHGEFKKAITPFSNRVNPLVSEGVQQFMNEDAFTGGKIDNGQGNGAVARLEHAASETPLTNIPNPNGHSVPEKLGNTFGLYEPHIKGNMASNKLPFLNVKNAQDGSTVAFPKDFTGEQGSKAVNDYLDSTGAKYSAKTAAQFNSQSPVDQKTLTAATKTLRQVGVTNAADIQKFAKLSAPDQQAYTDSVKALNTAGETVSSNAIEKHLVANGKLGLAASLNTNIPDNLTQDDKNTLEKYAVAGNGDQRKVWLQDNDNAASYYQAEINRKAATNALTNEDKDTTGTWSGTGNTLAVKALVAQVNKKFNVPQSLQQLYEDTTKGKYEKMSGAQKDALTQYANQLNQSGVLDKFGLGDGTSSGRGGSRSAFKNLGIPSGDVVVAPSKGTGLSVGTAKYQAPTLAVASSSTTSKANPFVRSISASKGVKV